MVDILYFVIKVFKPFIKILKLSTDFCEKILKIKKIEEPIEEELKDTIIDSNLEELEKKLLLNVFEFNDITIKDVMTKKEDVITIDVNASKEEILEKITKYKYTRFPIEKNNKIIGILNIKDLIISNEQNLKITKYLRKVKYLDSKTIIDDAFLLLNSNYESIAIVKENNEYIGIVTIEDIIEEIIGNVFDEYDDE